MALPPNALLGASNSNLFVVNCKVLVGFAQIILNITLIREVPWPSIFLAAVKLLSFVQLEIIPWQSVECAVSLDYYSKLLVVVITPVAFLLLLALCVILPIRLVNHYSMEDGDEQRKKRSGVVSDLWRAGVFTLFLIYPSVSSRLFGYLRCFQVGTKAFLMDDFREECYSKEWRNNLPMAVVGMVVYPFGVPLALFLLARSGQQGRGPRELEEPHPAELVTTHYTAPAWYWEVVDMVHKLLLTSVLPLLPSKPDRLAMSCGMGVAGLYMIALLLAQPYAHKSVYTLHLFSQCEVLLVLLAALVMQQERVEMDLLTDVALSLLFFALIATVLGYFALSTLVYLKDRRNAAQRHKRAASGKQLAGSQRQKMLRPATSSNVDFIDNPVSDPDSLTIHRDLSTDKLEPTQEK